MIKLKVLSVGKTKETWLQQAIEEYIKRLHPIAKITFVLVKKDSDLSDQIKEGEPLICLDPKGEMLSSEEFSKFLIRQVEGSGSRLTFVIGGPDGIPDSIKKIGPQISLSKLTFTHQITRLILLEQIYRAFEIAKGTRYHR